MPKSIIRTCNSQDENPLLCDFTFLCHHHILHLLLLIHYLGDAPKFSLNVSGDGGDVHRRQALRKISGGKHSRQKTTPFSLLAASSAGPDPTHLHKHFSPRYKTAWSRRTPALVVELCCPLFVAVNYVFARVSTVLPSLFTTGPSSSRISSDFLCWTRVGSIRCS